MLLWQFNKEAFFSFLRNVFFLSYLLEEVQNVNSCLCSVLIASTGILPDPTAFLFFSVFVGLFVTIVILKGKAIPSYPQSVYVPNSFKWGGLKNEKCYFLWFFHYEFVFKDVSQKYT